jgi:hypothetical protein
MRAMINRVRGLYNPLTINSFLSKIPQGITLDDNFTLKDMLELAVKFHGMNANAMLTYTLPTISAYNADVGDVLYVDQPAAQQLLVNLFGNSLLNPTSPPPDTALATPMPPHITPTTTTTTTTLAPSKAKTKAKGSTPTPTTTTTNPSQAIPYYDPRPCEPS